MFLKLKKVNLGKCNNLIIETALLEGIQFNRLNQNRVDKLNYRNKLTLLPNLYLVKNEKNTKKL